MGIVEGKTFLITGGCGLIGSAIIDQLMQVANGSEVVVMDNLSRGTLLNLQRALDTGRVELVREDNRYNEPIRPWFDGVDAVAHQAASRITRCAQEPREFHGVLIYGTF
jgi:UDP-glucose 4-epimerase